MSQIILCELRVTNNAHYKSDNSDIDLSTYIEMASLIADQSISCIAMVLQYLFFRNTIIQIQTPNLLLHDRIQKIMLFGMLTSSFKGREGVRPSHIGAP